MPAPIKQTTCLRNIIHSSKGSPAASASGERFVGAYLHETAENIPTITWWCLLALTERLLTEAYPRRKPFFSVRTHLWRNVDTETTNLTLQYVQCRSRLDLEIRCGWTETECSDPDHFDHMHYWHRKRLRLWVLVTWEHDVCTAKARHDSVPDIGLQTCERFS